MLADLPIDDYKLYRAHPSRAQELALSLCRTSTWLLEQGNEQQVSRRAMQTVKSSDVLALLVQISQENRQISILTASDMLHCHLA